MDSIQKEGLPLEFIKKHNTREYLPLEFINIQNTKMSVLLGTISLDRMLLTWDSAPKIGWLSGVKDSGPQIIVFCPTSPSFGMSFMCSFK